MALVLRHRGPRMIERGVAVTLDADVRDEAGTAQTVASGTLTVTDGSETVLSAVSVTGGTGATYALLAATTTSRATSDRWLERWSLTIGSTPYIFTRPAYLVRSVFTPTLTPTDLTNEYSDLNDILDPALSTWETDVTNAREEVERELIKRGRRPDLIFDSWALFDAHRHLTFHKVFKSAKASIGDGRYAELAEWHYNEYRREIDGAKFRYDSTETGQITDSTASSSTNPIILSSAPTNRRGTSYRRVY